MGVGTLCIEYVLTYSSMRDRILFNRKVLISLLLAGLMAMVVKCSAGGLFYTNLLDKVMRHHFGGQIVTFGLSVLISD